MTTTTDTLELIRLHGSVELAPATGLADAVLDITGVRPALPIIKKDSDPLAPLA